MKKLFKNFIKGIQEIKLTEDEKSILRSKISEFVSFNPIRGKSFVPGNINYLSIFEVRHFAKAGVVVLIFAVVIGGTGVSYAASNALPGEKLYGVKVNVNEEIASHLALTTEAKVAVQTKNVERRLEEVQKLVKTDKLSDNATKIVEKKIGEHIEDLSEEIDNLKEDGEVEAVLETTSHIAPVLEVHKEILEKNLDADVDDESPASNENTETLIARVEYSIEKVEAQEVTAISAALQNGPANAEATLMSEVVVDADAEAEAKAKKEKEEAEEKIEAEIREIVENRIDTAKAKIKTIKQNILAEKERAELEAKEESEEKAEMEAQYVATPASTSNSPILDTVGSTKEKILPPTSVTTTADVTMPVIEIKEEVVVAPVVKKETFDTRPKIREAERLLREAEELMERSKFEEALDLAQKVNKIAEEIETHRKLENLNLAKNTLESSTQKAEAMGSVKVETSTHQ